MVPFNVFNFCVTMHIVLIVRLGQKKMQDKFEGTLRALELGNDPPHDIDHPLPKNLFMASLWIGSGDNPYNCTYASRGDLPKAYVVLWVYY